MPTSLTTFKNFFLILFACLYPHEWVPQQRKVEVENQPRIVLFSLTIVKLITNS